jgi:hypothetical protein
LVKLGHCAAVPVIGPGVAGVPGLTITAIVEALLVPQVFPAVTDIVPLVVPVVTCIDVVPCPELIAQSPGTVHVYVVALGTAAMLYV